MHDSRAQFGPTAEAYLTSAVHSNQEALARIVEVARPEGGVVVDIATGAGHVAFAFAPHVDRMIATDVTPEMLAVALREAGARGLEVEAALVLAEAMAFCSGSLDGITCRVAAHHFLDVERFVGESARVLKPGGWFLLVDNVGIEEAGADDGLHAIEVARDHSHVRNHRASAWRRMIGGAGLEIEFEEIVPKPIPALEWLRRMRVPEAEQGRILERIVSSNGGLRDYLRPAGEGEELVFHLHEMLVLARKPSS